MDLITLLQQLINGLSLGSLYALIAIGYTMVYGILRLINFAHGDLLMVAAYVGVMGVGLFSWPWPVAFGLAFALTGLLGVLLERGAPGCCSWMSPPWAWPPPGPGGLQHPGASAPAGRHHPPGGTECRGRPEDRPLWLRPGDRPPGPGRSRGRAPVPPPASGRLFGRGNGIKE